MGEFTYTVFVVVTSTIGALLTLFVGVIATALMYDGGTPAHATVEPHVDSSPHFRQAA